MSPRSAIAATLLAALLCGSAAAQDDAKAVVENALTKMGGGAKVRRLRSVSLAIKGDTIKELHLVRLAGRMSVYTATRPSGRKLEIVLARGSAFVVDRAEDDAALKVEDLNESEAREAGYDRDLMLLPLLLPLLCDSPEALLRDEGKAPDGDRLIGATLPAPADSKEEPVRYTLRFSAKTGLLIGARSVIPAGPDQGRVRKVIYKGYEDCGGLTLPTQVRYKIDEDPVRGMDFSISLDTKVELTSFLKPKVEKAEEPR